MDIKNDISHFFSIQDDMERLTNDIIYSTQKGGISDKIKKVENESNSLKNKANEMKKSYQEEKFERVTPSIVTFYTIPKQTILYYASFKQHSFEPGNISFGTRNFTAYFSPTQRFASDRINACADYPAKRGFIHKFKTKKDLTKILIISRFKLNTDWSTETAENLYCKSNFSKVLNINEIDGIGVFYPTRVAIEKFLYEEDKINKPIDENNLKNIDLSQLNNKGFDVEFMLCNPNDDNLIYINTRECVQSRQLGNYTYK